MASFAIMFFKYVSQGPETFDRYCGFNIEAIGDTFVGAANKFAAGDFSELEFAFYAAYRYVVECQICFPGQLNGQIISMLSKIEGYECSGEVAIQVRFVRYQMVIGVVQRFFNHPRVGDIQSLDSLLKQAKSERETAESQIKEREAKVLELSKTLERYKTAFNFVGLYDGFKHLRDQKRSEANAGRAWLAILGLVMLIPFFLKFSAVFSPNSGLALDTAAYVSFVGFELVLEYFFRVGLNGYRSVRAQLMQIDLRMALCQFIQEYANYAKDIQKTSPGTLDKFDQLIFSGIVNDEGAIPSTFDGVEQLANLIGKIKAR